MEFSGKITDEAICTYRLTQDGRFFLYRSQRSKDFFGSFSFSQRWSDLLSFAFSFFLYFVRGDHGSCSRRCAGRVDVRSSAQRGFGLQ